MGLYFDLTYTKVIFWLCLCLANTTCVYCSEPVYPFPANGTYLYCSSQYYLPGLTANFMSPYLLVEENFCLEMYYQVAGGHLGVSRAYPGQDRQRIWTVGKVREQPDGSWEQAVIPLSKGYYRLYIEAYSTCSSDNINVAIDDIYINKCRTRMYLHQQMSDAWRRHTFVITLHVWYCKHNYPTYSSLHQQLPYMCIWLSISICHYIPKSTNIVLIFCN